MAGRALKIHLEEGTATGLQTIEIDNWTGKVIIALKSDLPNLLKRQELQSEALGIYVLIGKHPTQIGTSKIYIGQGKVAGRLVRHSRDAKKVFWDNKVLVIVAKDDSLNAAHCRYIERRLIELAKKSNSNRELKNDVIPKPVPLSHTDKTQADNFLEQALTLLPVLNIDYFDQTAIPTSSVSSPRFTFVTRAGTAEAEIINNEFVVLKNSNTSPNETQSIGPSNRQLRAQLRANGSIANDPASGKWIFTRNVSFETPSAAAGVVGGASIAGPTAWKIVATQQTYRDWLQNQVNAVAPPTTGPAPTAGTTP